MLAVTYMLVFTGLLQALVDSQMIDRDLEAKKQATIQQARSEIMILTNELMMNASMITQTADGNASRILADLNNEINRGIANAQLKIAQIVNSFQANFSKRADEILKQASTMYTNVQSKLLNSTQQLEIEISRILNKTEIVINNTFNADNGSTQAVSSTIPNAK